MEPEGFITPLTKAITGSYPEAEQCISHPLSVSQGSILYLPWLCVFFCIMFFNQTFAYIYCFPHDSPAHQNL